MRKPTKAERALARRAASEVKRWAKLVGLSPNWAIETRVVWSEDEADPEFVDKVAHSEFNADYFDAVITFNAFYEETSKRLPWLAAHEIFHLLFSEIQNVIDDALGEKSSEGSRIIEQLVTSLELMVERLHRP